MKSIVECYGNYLNIFEREKRRLKRLDEQILKEEDLTDRKNFNGHVTASGLVICPEGKKGLLIFHNNLQMYIQPGGHLEEVDKDLFEASRREINEETGLVDFELHEWCKKYKTPLLIDSHKIPANHKKDEDEHYHHDFMFLFKAKSKDIILQVEEVSDAKWVDLEELVGSKDAVGKAVERYLELDK